MAEKYDIAILGGGPGGYVAAIRAAQLGFKTVVIDKDKLGGICLNWGCIPTKSLLKNAELYDNIKNHGEEFGITVKELSFDFSKIIKRSRDISDKITKNVEMLIKKNKIDRIKGYGKLTSKNEIKIFDENKILFCGDLEIYYKYQSYALKRFIEARQLFEAGDDFFKFNINKFKQELKVL